MLTSSGLIWEKAKTQNDRGEVTSLQRGTRGAGSALRAAPSGTPAAPRPPSARHRPTIRCLRQSLWLKPALPANPLTTNYHFCRIPSLTTRGTLSVSHFRGRVHLGKIKGHAFLYISSSERPDSVLLNFLFSGFLSRNAFDLRSRSFRSIRALSRLTS